MASIEHSFETGARKDETPEHRRQRDAIRREAQESMHALLARHEGGVSRKHSTLGTQPSADKRGRTKKATRAKKSISTPETGRASTSGLEHLPKYDPQSPKSTGPVPPSLSGYEKRMQEGLDALDRSVGVSAQHAAADAARHSIDSEVPKGAEFELDREQVRELLHSPEPETGVPLIDTQIFEKKLAQRVAERKLILKGAHLEDLLGIAYAKSQGEQPEVGLRLGRRFRREALDRRWIERAALETKAIFDANALMLTEQQSDVAETPSGESGEEVSQVEPDTDAEDAGTQGSGLRRERVRPLQRGVGGSPANINAARRERFAQDRMHAVGGGRPDWLGEMQREEIAAGEPVTLPEGRRSLESRKDQSGATGEASAAATEPKHEQGGLSGFIERWFRRGSGAMERDIAKKIGLDPATLARSRSSSTREELQANVTPTTSVPSFGRRQAEEVEPVIAADAPEEVLPDDPTASSQSPAEGVVEGIGAKFMEEEGKQWVQEIVDRADYQDYLGNIRNLTNAVLATDQDAIEVARAKLLALRDLLNDTSEKYAGDTVVSPLIEVALERTNEALTFFGSDTNESPAAL